MDEEQESGSKPKRGRYMQYLDPSVEHPNEEIPRSSAFLMMRKTSQRSELQDSNVSPGSSGLPSDSEANNNRTSSSPTFQTPNKGTEPGYPELSHGSPGLPSDPEASSSSTTESSHKGTELEDSYASPDSPGFSSDTEAHSPRNTQTSIKVSGFYSNSKQSKTTQSRTCPDTSEDESDVMETSVLSEPANCGTSIAPGFEHHSLSKDSDISIYQQISAQSHTTQLRTLPPASDDECTVLGTSLHRVPVQCAIGTGSQQHPLTEDLNQRTLLPAFEDDLFESESLLNPASGSQLVERISLIGSDGDISSSDSEDCGSNLPSTVEHAAAQDEGGRALAETNESVPVKKSFERLKSKLQSDFLEPIHQSPVLSRGEIILNALRFSCHFNLPHVAEEALMKFVNSIFGFDVLPSTKYLLDKLFFSDNLLTYHFYCCSCLSYFGTNVHNFVCCRNCMSGNNVGNLNLASYFVVLDLAAQLELMLCQPDVSSQYRQPKDLINPNENILTDLYDGIMYRNFARSLDYSNDFKHISGTMCADGSPLYSSSKCSIWPLLVMTHEFLPLTRSKNLLLGALWFGNSKPKMSMFLKPFTDHVNHFSSVGRSLTVNNETWKVKFHLLASCVDAAARGPVQGIHQFNGAFGCSWCLHPGKTLEKTIKYPNISPVPQKRTAAEVLKDGEEFFSLVNRTNYDIHVRGVIDISPLNTVSSFDIVNSMILEYLHNGVLGVTRHMCNAWLGSHGTKDVIYYCGEPENLKEIDRRLLKITPPKEVRRCPRSINERKFWKGKEWEAWALYYSLPVMKGILPESHWKHWHLFVQALHILLSTEVSVSMLKVAHELLTEFVTQIEFLYRREDEEYSTLHMTYNVHILQHLAENVYRWGPLWSINGYCFEAENQILKAMVHANKGIPHQICRAYSKQKAMELIDCALASSATETFENDLRSNQVKKFLSIGNMRFMGKMSSFTPTEAELWLFEDKGLDQLENYVCCERMIIDGALFSVKASKVLRTNNSYVLLFDSSIAVIRKIIVDSTSEQCYVFLSKVYCSPYRPKQCVPTKDVALWKVDGVSESLVLHSVKMLKRICVYVHLQSDCYISVPPNIFNVC